MVCVVFYRRYRACLPACFAGLLLAFAYSKVTGQQPFAGTEMPPLPLPQEGDSSSLALEVQDSLAFELFGPKISFNDVDVPVFADSVYRALLQALNTTIPLDYNQQVKNYIELYVLKRRNQVRRLLTLSKFYYPIFDRVFAAHGLPPEIKHLSIVESALNPHAISRAGATGLWQFMYSTAKIYGLQINPYLDDRRDIIRSTEGAAQYLKSMYNLYGDWLLAIASYNCGPQNVNKAIQRSGKNTFWEIQKYLPRETQGYVPAFIAATYVMNYYYLHNLFPDYTSLPHCFDSLVCVPVAGRMAFEQIARFTGMQVDELRFLNPGLRSNVIPELPQPYQLKLPSDKHQLFYQYLDSILHYSANVKVQYYYPPPIAGVKTYTVRSGDNLSTIARKHGVTVAQLQRWNKLRGTVIHPGQKIKIYSSRYAEAADPMSKASHSRSSQQATGSSPPASGAASSEMQTSAPGTASHQREANPETSFIYYKVRYGDTLWGIARRYGTTVEHIRMLNGSKCENLKAGSILKIQSKS